MALALTRVTTGTTISSTTENANQVLIENKFAHGISSADLVSGVALLTEVTHGNLGVSNLHDADQVYLLDTADYYTGVNLETALAQLGPLAKTTADRWNIKFVGKSKDVTVRTSANADPSNSIVVPINIATYGVLVSFNSQFYDGGIMSIWMRLAINGTVIDSSTDPAIFHEFILYGSSGSGDTSRPAYLEMAYLVADGWNPAIENTITIDGVITSGTMRGIIMNVKALF